MSEPKSLREKVNAFLQAAIAETDDAVRTSLIGKATYWHQVALRERQKAELRPESEGLAHQET